MVRDWAGSFAVLRARLVAAQASLLGRLSWRTRLDFDRGALDGWKGSGQALLLGSRRLAAWPGPGPNARLLPASSRRTDVLPAYTLLFGSPAGLPLALAGAQQPLVVRMRQLCASIRRLAKEYQAATGAACTATDGGAPDAAPPAKRLRSCRAALLPANN